MAQYFGASNRLNEIKKCMAPLSVGREMISAEQSSKSIREKISSMKIGVIGFGQMNGALVEGFMNSEMVVAENLFVLQVSKQRAEAAKKLGVKKVHGEVNPNAIKQMAQFSDIILIGVKPQDFNKTLSNLSGFITEKHLIISIAAGISIPEMMKNLKNNIKVVRVMPNTPSLVGCGASGYALGKNTGPQESLIVKTLLSSVGIAFQVSEKNLDAVTGVSGSSPAYIYIIIQAMADGGVKAGLPRNIALSLAAKAVEGAAKMVMPNQQTLNHPGALKDKVTSPAGTTISAISVLQNRGIRSAFMDAVVTAAQRSEELGKR